MTPSIEYGGTTGETEYFFTGRYLTSDEGIENPTSSLTPIHDDTHQGGASVMCHRFSDNSIRD